MEVYKFYEDELTFAYVTKELCIICSYLIYDYSLTLFILNKINLYELFKNRVFTITSLKTSVRSIYFEKLITENLIPQDQLYVSFDPLRFKSLNPYIIDILSQYNEKIHSNNLR